MLNIFQKFTLVCLCLQANLICGSDLDEFEFMESIRKDYCDELNTLDYHNNCTFSNNKQNEIMTSNYTMELKEGFLQIECSQEKEVEHISLISLGSKINLEMISVNCPFLKWSCIQFMRLLGVRKVLKFQQDPNHTKFYSVEIKAIDIDVINGPQLLDLYILNSNAEIIAEANSSEIFGLYGNLTTIRVTIDFHTKLPSYFFTLYFPNLEEIYWENKGPASLTHQMIFELKNLRSLNYVTYKLPEQNKIHFKNMIQLRELRLQTLSYQPTINLDCDFLSGDINLESFSFDGQAGIIFIYQPDYADQNSNLNLSVKHFQSLKSLKTLKLEYIKLADYEFLRSPTLQTNLEYLSLYTHDGKYPNEEYLKDYDKLKIITRSKKAEEYKSLTVFQCNDVDINCKFSIGINGERCPNNCRCQLEPEPMRFVIMCNKTGYASIPNLPIPITGNATLFFENVKLPSLPSIADNAGYANLHEIHVCNNAIKRFQLEHLPPNITVLDIKNNQLHSLDDNVIQFFESRAATLTLSLSRNPWICDCGSMPFVKMIQKLSNKTILDHSDVRCKSNGTRIIELQERDLCTSYVFIFLVILLVLGIPSYVILIFKKPILLWMYGHNILVNWIKLRNLDLTKKYDGFLSFSQNDSEFIPEYLEKLENGPRKYRLCFYQRDWIIGKCIPDCICESVDDSKRTIILLTNNFLESSWGRMEFRKAMQATSKNKCKRLIVVLYSDVSIESLDGELKRYLTYNSYLKRNDGHFWEKLLQAMP